MKKNHLSVIVIIFSLLFFSSLTIKAEEECVKNAWNAFNSKKYELAIQYADECIDNFAKAAMKIQKELEEKDIPLPPTGAVPSAEKQKIFNRGLLNDVSTAYFIKGRSAEYLYKRDKVNPLAELIKK